MRGCSVFGKVTCLNGEARRAEEVGGDSITGVKGVGEGMKREVEGDL